MLRELLRSSGTNTAITLVYEKVVSTPRSGCVCHLCFLVPGRYGRPICSINTAKNNMRYYSLRWCRYGPRRDVF